MHCKRRPDNWYVRVHVVYIIDVSYHHLIKLSLDTNVLPIKIDAFYIKR